MRLKTRLVSSFSLMLATSLFHLSHADTVTNMPPSASTPNADTHANTEMFNPAAKEAFSRVDSPDSGNGIASVIDPTTFNTNTMTDILHSNTAAPHSSTLNVYTHANAGMFNPATHSALARVYVPNSGDGTVSVIDPATYTVVDTYATGKTPQHVVPSYDLKTLWVLNNGANSLTPIDPSSAKPGKNIAVLDPYNLYFTPDGRSAIVVCESRKRLEFRDPQTMALQETVPVKCEGINHMDFTQDGRYGVATCEFSGQLLRFDVTNHKVVDYLTLSSPHANLQKSKHLALNAKNTFYIEDITRDGTAMIDVNTSEETGFIPNKKKEEGHRMSMPQDIRLSPDGRIFYVADMMRDGVILIDANKFREIGFIRAGIGTHGIYPSRDGQFYYVSNRGCHASSCPPHGAGSISVIDPAKQAIVATWKMPDGGSPDMGNVSADGKELWLSGRFDKEVYVFDTTTGELTHRIPVGRGPHGLTVWPQPGQYSLGHTGNMR